MEIEEGEYIRTKYGIAKIIRDCTDDKSYFDCFDIDRELDGCNFINDFEILKHSKNIIDLIEEGDYVNGIRIEPYMLGFVGNTQIKLLLMGADVKIERIVTKEQFENVEYKVGE